ncbi:hypothetical protein NX059_009382 [Plenodomus lindquistii]|nr:hypothetical protein NX059_009382 [Plenodomus lindquistii]
MASLGWALSKFGLKRKRSLTLQEKREQFIRGSRSTTPDSELEQEEARYQASQRKWEEEKRKRAKRRQRGKDSDDEYEDEVRPSKRPKVHEPTDDEDEVIEAAELDDTHMWFQHMERMGTTSRGEYVIWDEERQQAFTAGRLEDGSLGKVYLSDDEYDLDLPEGMMWNNDGNSFRYAPGSAPVSDFGFPDDVQGEASSELEDYIEGEEIGLFDELPVEEDTPESNDTAAQIRATIKDAYNIPPPTPPKETLIRPFVMASSEDHARQKMAARHRRHAEERYHKAVEMHSRMTPGPKKDELKAAIRELRNNLLTPSPNSTPSNPKTQKSPSTGKGNFTEPTEIWDEEGNMTTPTPRRKSDLDLASSGSDEEEEMVKQPPKAAGTPVYTGSTFKPRGARGPRVTKSANQTNYFSDDDDVPVKQAAKNTHETPRAPEVPAQNPARNTQETSKAAEISTRKPPLSTRPTRPQAKGRAGTSENGRKPVIPRSTPRPQPSSSQHSTAPAQSTDAATNQTTKPSISVKSAKPADTPKTSTLPKPPKPSMTSPHPPHTRKPNAKPQTEAEKAAQSVKEKFLPHNLHAIVDASPSLSAAKETIASSWPCPLYTIRDVEIRDTLDDICDQIRTLSRDHFGAANTHFAVDTRFFERLTDDTARLVGCVASGGPGGEQGWIELFDNVQKRRALICAMVGNLLVEQVLRHPFFGGGEEGSEEVGGAEERFRDGDGFERNTRIAEIISAALTDATASETSKTRLPPDFNNHVVRVVQAIWAHLSLINYLLEGEEHTIPSAIFSTLFKIVTHAGILSLLLRQDKRTVYYFEPLFKEDEFNPTRMECYNYLEMRQRHPRTPVAKLSKEERARRAELTDGEKQRALSDRPLTQITIMPGLRAYRLGGWEKQSSTAENPEYEVSSYENEGIRSQKLTDGWVYCRWGRARGYNNGKVGSGGNARLHGDAWQGGFLEFHEVDGVPDWLGRERAEREARKQVAKGKGKGKERAATVEEVTDEDLYD